MHTSDILIELTPAEDGAGGEYRTISDRVLVGKVRVPAAQARSTQAWRMALETQVHRPGDIDTPYAHAIAGYAADERLLASTFAWLQKQGMPDLSEIADVTIAGCMAACYHHDIAAYADSLFCVVWLEESRGLELVFPDLGRRVPLHKGTLVVFDSAQPHSVLRAGQPEYLPSDYEDLPVQVFLSVDFKANVPDVAECAGFRLLDSAEGWPGLMVDVTSNGPVLDPGTGKWRSRLRKGPSAEAMAA